MCGRMAAVLLMEDMKRQIPIPVEIESDKMYKNYNISPNHTVLVITADKKVKRMQWGIERPGKKVAINCRSDTLLDTSVWKSYAQHRGIIIVTGYFEWKSQQKPYYISHPNKPLLIAGIIDEKSNRVSIITTAANSSISSIHHRMPVLLSSVKEIEMWLDRDIPIYKCRLLCVSYPKDDLKVYEVSTHVNQVKHNDPKCIASLESVKKRGIASFFQPSTKKRKVDPNPIDEIIID